MCTSDEPLWRVTERAGLVFQNPASQMLAQSVEDEIVFGLENLGLPSGDIAKRVEAAVARFALEPMLRRAPLTLSGGEQQKVALAAITARQPDILVLDEPLSMLDGTAAAALVVHLAELAAAGTTIVICEHREEYVRPIPDLRTLHLDGPNNGTETSFSSRIPGGEAGSPSIVEISGLGVTLGGQSILHNLSCTFAGGEVTAIVGRNGVGKTTLLRAMAGLEDYDGHITADGDEPDLGIVFQNADLQLFNATVRDEILFRVPQPDMDLYRWLLDALDLARYQDAPPLLLSEGEKKRLALATVVMRGPRHGILLDEPALGQDARHKTRLVRAARALAQEGKIVALTTHDLTLASQADRLLLLGTEGFVADGPPADILQDRATCAEAGLLVPDWVDVRGQVAAEGDES